MIRNLVNDLKEQHTHELLSCKSQFETDIRNAIERAQQSIDDGLEEPMLELGYQYEPGIDMKYFFCTEIISLG